ncbi:hypothetical protein AA0472_0278 [Acetobacter estunensis NRIC 0472]|uniref:maltose acetyltransferase domain-containing protein n=1 Tax=Acetobacter estunensis TaxID=104097 RepID=UPI001F55691A|nr:maltose acetyltransferase domain-containing protein [Acetobacter estunensis]GBQ20890.1 hypothetical protein AA0472_0278 [Acetobacter estunensis NRIC 0472]
MMSQHSEKQKMLAGDLYVASAPELQHDMAQCTEWLARYNKLERSLPDRLSSAITIITSFWDTMCF